MLMTNRRYVPVLAFVLLAGCARHEKEPPLWEQVKIGDLAPQGGDRAPAGLNTTNFDIYVFQVPAERVRDLRCLWDALNAKPFRYRNHNAFRSNAFRVAKGSAQQWDWIVGSLNQAGARTGTTVRVLLSGDQEDEVTITALGLTQKVTFTDKEGLSQQVVVGPGRLVLRLRAEPMRSAQQVCQLVAYPVFTVSAGGAIEELAAMARAKEVAFLAAAFSTPIRQGDILVLGPEDYYGDPSTLGGLFFCDSRDTVLIDPRTAAAVQRRRAVRVYVMVCARLSEETP